MPKTKGALDAEWNTLGKREAWLLNTAREKAKVLEEENRKGETVHFDHLMELCHIEHSEFAEEYQVAKGKVVFRGEHLRDQEGYLAVFSEQGTSVYFSCLLQDSSMLSPDSLMMVAKNQTRWVYAQSELKRPEI
jgi:hypothetical protein